MPRNSSPSTKIRQNKPRKESPRQKGSAGRDSQELQDFALGEKETEYKMTYAPEVLEAFANKNPKAQAWTTFVCTEFTSLCPKTAQPDFAKIFINYIAGDLMVESKSLKLYLFSFRNHGDFHEDCVQKICDDLVRLLNPLYLEVVGEFTPRGGIAIFPFASYASAKKEHALFQKIKLDRMINYAPGKYSMDLAKLY